MLTYGVSAFRAVAPKLGVELAGLMAGLLLLSSVVFGPSGISVGTLAIALLGGTPDHHPGQTQGLFSALSALSQGLSQASVIAAAAWALATGPALRVVLFGNCFSYLKWLPGPRWVLGATSFGLLLVIHAPWFALWAAGWAAGLPPTAVLAPMALAPLGSIAIGWLLAHTAVRPPVPGSRWAAHAWATAVAILRPGISALTRAIGVALLGGAVLGLVAGGDGTGVPVDSQTVWGVIALVAVVTMPSLARAIVDDARARTWLLQSVGTSPMQMRITLAGGGAFVGALIAVAVCAAAAILGHWPLGPGTVARFGQAAALGGMLTAIETLLMFDSATNDGARAIAYGCGLGLACWWCLAAFGGAALVGVLAVAVLLATRVPREQRA